MSYALDFADVYNGSAYGATSYGSSATTAPAKNGASVSGTLSNTGFDILLVGSLACFIIFIAVMVRFWHRPVSDK
jgi:tellurite resistance protein TehA-like permease